MIHRQADKGPVAAIVRLVNSRKSLLQIDRARLQRQCRERRGKAPDVEQNAPGLAQPLDASEVIEIRRPGDRQRRRGYKLT
jgi:hypothetical protein